MKKTRKRGISLIVLIVTIIVIIILAAVVILALNNNNPISSAKEAAFKEDVRGFQDELSMSLAREYTLNPNSTPVINATSYEDIKEYIPSFTKKYEGMFEIKNNGLVYVGDDKQNENTWAQSLNVPTQAAANWDDTATAQSCFKWASDNENEDGYHIIIGYNSDLQNYPKVRIPTRCKKIICDQTYYNSDSDTVVGRAFLSNIGTIEIPSTVDEIGTYAFGSFTGTGLTSVKSITIPDSVTKIGALAFACCTGLTNITIPDSVTDIIGGAFFGCTSLTSVTIPNGITHVGANSFQGTPWYNSKPDGLIYIGKVLCEYKGNMPENTSINISEGITTIAESAFYDRKGLTSITIPNSVTYIEGHAFQFCKGLTSITIPDSVTSIGDYAFFNCSGLTGSITIPDSVTSIGDSAFTGCDNLTINCRATSKPSGWDSNWNSDCNATINWGYTGN